MILTCLCTENEDHLQQYVQNFQKYVCGLVCKFSVEKSEIMLQRAKYGPSPKTPKICIESDGHHLKTCNKFFYLGTVITDNALLDKEVQTRIHRAKAAFSKLYQRVWTRNTLSLKTKVSVYRRTILPILTQDCETLHLSYAHFKKMEGCQYKFLRTICNKQWQDFIHYT